MMCDQWVSVKSSYPPENGRYLVVYFLSTKPPISWMRVLGFAKDLYEVDHLDFENKKGKAGFYGYDSEFGYYEVDDVTHWMPLPEPPKEEDGET